MAEKNRRDWLGTAMFRKFGCDFFRIQTRFKQSEWKNPSMQQRIAWWLFIFGFTG